MIQRESEMSLSTIHKLINSIWNEEELIDQWKVSIIVPCKIWGSNARDYEECCLLEN
jgi:hypothetical protein